MYTAVERYRWHCNNAKKRNLENTLSLEEYTAYRDLECYICHQTTGCGIDRVDNNLGYVPGNMEPCCGRCNKLKGDRDLRTFKNDICEIWHGIQHGEALT